MSIIRTVLYYLDHIIDFDCATYCSYLRLSTLLFVVTLCDSIVCSVLLRILEFSVGHLRFITLEVCVST